MNGVLDQNKQSISRITPTHYPEVATHVRHAGGQDVTGGMAGKVQQMLGLVQNKPEIKVHIINGTKAGSLQALLLGENYGEGTLIEAE